MIKRQFDVQDLELRGSLALLKGEAIDGLTLLTQAAPKELEYRAYYDDPPFYPTLDVGEARIRVSRSVEPEAGGRRVQPRAQGRAERSVRARRARARASRARRRRGRRDAMGRLEFVWSDAEPGLRWLTEARATGIKAAPIDRSPVTQRNYRRTTLEQFGPAIWTPFAAPALDVHGFQPGSASRSISSAART